MVSTPTKPETTLVNYMVSTPTKPDTTFPFGIFHAVIQKITVITELQITLWTVYFLPSPVYEFHGLDCENRGDDVVGVMATAAHLH